MEILGSQIIPASQQDVWDALNSPEILKKCLPGCESVELISPNLFKVIITTAIGPLKAKFNGTLNVTEASPPDSCVLIFEGQGGAVGFGKGSSSVTLKTVEGGTELNYSAQAHVGGKLAQIGSRLIDSVAKKMSDDFFKAFNHELTSNPDIPPSSESLSPTPISAVPISSQNGETTPKGQVSTAIQPVTSLNQQVPAYWLIIAAGVGAAIVVVAELILR
jgi:carbon monoxide dehydrogenase subunit G